MRTRRFDVRLFGYERSAVNDRLAELERELQDSKSEAGRLRARLSQAESQKEELSVTVAAMRRQQIQMVSRSGMGEPVSVIVGPADSLGLITGLIDALEGSPHFSAQFRVFRDGFYRVDGQAHDRANLLGWLKGQTGVRDVSADEETLHVLPRGVSA